MYTLLVIFVRVSLPKCVEILEEGSWRTGLRFEVVWEVDRTWDLHPAFCTSAAAPPSTVALAVPSAACCKVARRAASAVESVCWVVPMSPRGSVGWTGVMPALHHVARRNPRFPGWALPSSDLAVWNLPSSDVESWSLPSSDLGQWNLSFSEMENRSLPSSEVGHCNLPSSDPADTLVLWLWLSQGWWGLGALWRFWRDSREIRGVVGGWTSHDKLSREEEDSLPSLPSPLHATRCSSWSAARAARKGSNCSRLMGAAGRGPRPPIPAWNVTGRRLVLALVLEDPQVARPLLSLLPPTPWWCWTSTLWKLCHLY